MPSAPRPQPASGQAIAPMQIQRTGRQVYCSFLATILNLRLPHRPGFLKVVAVEGKADPGCAGLVFLAISAVPRAGLWREDVAEHRDVMPIGWDASR